MILLLIEFKLHFQNLNIFFSMPGCQTLGRTEESSCHELRQIKPISTILLWERNNAESCRRKVSQKVHKCLQKLNLCFKSVDDLSWCENCIELRPKNGQKQRFPTWDTRTPGGTGKISKGTTEFHQFKNNTKIVNETTYFCSLGM